METVTQDNAQVETRLSDWNRAMDLALARGEPLDAAAMAQIVLREIPRHLATYQRLLRITWALKRWGEGEDWARRLLQADPGNALAWRSLARAAEQRSRRAQAHAMWQRAFEMAPYDPETRAGLARTSLDDPNAPALDLACLGTLYRRGRRWGARGRGLSPTGEGGPAAHRLSDLSDAGPLAKPGDGRSLCAGASSGGASAAFAVGVGDAGRRGR